MSTRFYPRFVKGNPQLRIFLPDWKMVMIKTKDRFAMPDNVVSFKVDVKMTDWDIKNYLKKIYKVEVADIKSRIIAGDLRRTSKGLAKDDDYKIANVTLPIGQKFKWPELFPKEKFKEQLSDYEMTLKQINKDRKIDPNLKDIPNWFI